MFELKLMKARDLAAINSKYNSLIDYCRKASTTLAVLGSLTFCGSFTAGIYREEKINQELRDPLVSITQKAEEDLGRVKYLLETPSITNNYGTNYSEQVQKEVRLAEKEGLRGRANHLENAFEIAEGELRRLKNSPETKDYQEKFYLATNKNGFMVLIGSLGGLLIGAASIIPNRLEARFERRRKKEISSI